MNKLCFATNNKHKIAEINKLLGEAFKIQSLEEIGCRQELPENQNTLEGNSLEKAKFVFDHFNEPCFADDTGLEVDALNGAPGVISARYAGDQKNSDDNIDLLLKNLEGIEERNARFRTVITLVSSKGTKQFEGKVEGYILKNKKGNRGFGYDPIFIPKGHTRTFAELTMDEKNTISHRGRAFKKLVDYLNANLIK
jgi:XTP/dITP diphosphohydrolase